MTDRERRTVIERSAALALAGVAREYPNKIAHHLDGPEDVLAPRTLTPIFFGCYDWHSAVHGHWLLARALRTVPDGAFAAPARAWLHDAFTAERVAGEIAYLTAPGRRGFERPYGLAWLLRLAEELATWDDADARAWREILAPLERHAADHLLDWLPLLSHPVRTGEHAQTAFAMALSLDWARARGDDDAARLLARRALDFHAEDRGWRLAFEPSGQDFLSPSLAEADLLRRVLEPPAFAAWLDAFLPELRDPGPEAALRPAFPADPTDGKLVHLDGLNLSRAWMLEGIAGGLPADDARRPGLRACAGAHRAAGLAALDRDDYVGTHWLGTFATYLVTGCGL